MSYRVTPISVHITPEGEHPTIGNGMTLTLVDEGGGPFLEIADTSDRASTTLRVELEELELLVVEARRLIAAATEAGGQP